jgi:hypothetical protein
VNSVPHFTNDVSGRSFPTAFASPPGQGLSPAWVNVLWGLFNLLVGCLLMSRVELLVSGRSAMLRLLELARCSWR